MYWMIIQTRLTNMETTLDPYIEVVFLQNDTEEELKTLLDEHERNDMQITVVPLHMIRNRLDREELISSELIFALIELTTGTVKEFYEEFADGIRIVEMAIPSRWYNPVLIVTPKSFWGRFMSRGEGEYEDLIPIGMDIRDVVIAIPNANHGYGRLYLEDVESNRKRFALEEVKG